MIIFDLDGTLADCEHRRHFVDPEAAGDRIRKCVCSETGKTTYKKYTGELWRPDWKAFYEACDKDEPIKQCISIFERLNEYRHVHDEIQIWTGRCESVLKKTIEWLKKYTLFEECNHKLKMRPIGDSTPDNDLKEKWLDESLAQGKEVDFVFDDRPKVVRMWRRRGIFVFDVNQRGNEF